MRDRQRKRATEMAAMRDRGNTWGAIAARFHIDRSNARKAVIRHNSKRES